MCYVARADLDLNSWLKDPLTSASHVQILSVHHDWLLSAFISGRMPRETEELSGYCTASQGKNLILNSLVQVLSPSSVKVARRKIFIWSWLAPPYIPGTMWDQPDQLCYCL